MNHCIFLLIFCSCQSENACSKIACNSLKIILQPSIKTMFISFVGESHQKHHIFFLLLVSSFKYCKIVMYPLIIFVENPFFHFFFSFSSSEIIHLLAFVYTLTSNLCIAHHNTSCGTLSEDFSKSTNAKYNFFFLPKTASNLYSYLIREHHPSPCNYTIEL